MEVQPTHPIKVFYCYAHEDDVLREQLASHLSPLRRLRDITGWFDRDIQAGTEWEQESKMHLDAANVILVLVSANFMASDYRYTVEMTHALERHQAGTARVIPILLKPVDWEDTPLGILSPLPTNRVPVTQWADPEAALLNISQGIKEIVRSLLPKQDLSPQDAEFLYPKQGTLSGQTVGEKYVLGELLGEGGFGAVYKAQHLHLQRPQAVKILLERHFQKSAFRERFLREAQTAAALDHPHIIHLDDFGVEPARAYLVMPFIQGGTFQSILQRQQSPFKLEQIVWYLEHICAALDYAHAKGVAHLDLKPLNLLVRDDGGLLLADFGLSHLIKQGVIEGGTSLLVGSPHYMAPEHIQGHPEQRSDLFSLGVILYQMLAGRLPFEGSTPEAVLSKNLTEWPATPRMIRPELPLGVEDVVRKALAKQPMDRYQTAEELLIAFKQALILPLSLPQLPSSSAKTPFPLLHPIPSIVKNTATHSPQSVFMESPEAIEALRTLTAHKREVLAVAWSADGKILASGESYNTIHLWNAQTSQLLRTLEHEDHLESMEWSTNGQILVLGTSEGIKLWSAPTGLFLHADRLKYSGGQSEAGRLNCVTLSPNGRTLACSFSQTIRFWDAQKGLEIRRTIFPDSLPRTLKGHSASIEKLAWRPDGKMLASGSKDCTVKIWGMQKYKLFITLSDLTGHTREVSAVAWNPDGQTLASGSYDHTIKIWNAQTGQLLRTLTDHSGPILSIAWNPDGQTLASGSGDETIKLWNGQTGQLLRTLAGHSSRVKSVAWHPDGQTLASGSDDKTIKLWGLKE